MHVCLFYTVLDKEMQFLEMSSFNLYKKQFVQKDNLFTFGSLGNKASLGWALHRVPGGQRNPLLTVLRCHYVFTRNIRLRISN